ncbi:MAG: ATP-dependent helicase [Ardenticatenia bacterium]|nr:ATP-dependent helicase [Ardenticatenia bacterium]
MTRRQLTIKPSCMREIAMFPSDRAGLLWDKIDALVSDPLPDGKVKKKLKGGDGVYRLRLTDHRVFYRFGEGWISLLGIRRRAEDTYDDVPDGTGVVPAPDEGDDDLDALIAAEKRKVFQFTTTTTETPLPEPLTQDLLRELSVPVSAVQTLLRCKTEEALLDADVPSEVLERVINHLFPPTIEQLDQQPDLVVPSTKDLVRFKEGDLLGFLLQLDEEQLRLTTWALNGPTMVRGGAGTGKSTVALYRIKALLERPGATGTERVLFTTYTRALLTVTQQLLEQLLSPEQMKRVEVATCDQIAWRIVGKARKVGQFESDNDTLRRLARLRATHVPLGSPFEARLRARALERLSDIYLLEEFDWIIDGRGLTSLAEYQAAPRPGRGLSLNERARAAVWDLYEVFSKSGGERYPALRREALKLITEDKQAVRYDYVVVDEAQDLSPVSLALLAEACKTAEGLFFAADNKQSLYSRNYTWGSAHPRLQFRGRTALLSRNYRSTREIDRAAFSVLQAGEGDELVASNSVHEGPLPVLVRGIAADHQAEWIARFIRQMARHLHLKASAAAVLVPVAAAGETLASELQAQGIAARYFPGRELDLKADVVRVLTLHSAKGLEFPIVIVAGLESGTWPVPEDFEEPDLYAERARHERRVLYVGLTRAMRGLMLISPQGCRHPGIVDLDLKHWHMESAL